jgi:hypothetical protein
LQGNNPKDTEKEADRIVQQMKQWGATQEDIDRFKADHQGDKTSIEQDAVIWVENRTTVSVFLALTTQWNLQPMTGQRIGLDKKAVDLEIKNSLELLDATPRRRAEVYQEITAMEHAAVAQLRKQEQK